MGETKILLVEILTRKVASQAVHNIGEGGIELTEPAHEGALTHAKFGSNNFGSRLASGNQVDQSPLQLLDEIIPLPRPTPKNLLGVIVQDRQEPVVW